MLTSSSDIKVTAFAWVCVIRQPPAHGTNTAAAEAATAAAGTKGILTFTTGAKQLVVHDAAVTMWSFAGSYAACNHTLLVLPCYNTVHET
jgi:hypothetical protein